jgi:hypothetical protein
LKSLKEERDTPDLTGKAVSDTESSGIDSSTSPLISRVVFPRGCPMKESRIFVQPPSGSSFHNITQQAHEILRMAGITSARLGGIINNQGVVIVDLVDLPRALEALIRAGLRAATDLI